MDVAKSETFRNFTILEKALLFESNLIKQQYNQYPKAKM